MAIVNARDFLLNRAQQCERKRGRRPNVLAGDVCRTGDMVEFARELNGVQ